MTNEAVQRVRAYLQAHAPEIHVVEFDVSTATASLAAAAVGCELGAIVKSLCFLVDDQPVITLVAGDRKVDDRKLGAVFGAGKGKVRIADPETVARVTGFGVGGVPPVAHTSSSPVVIDATLERFPLVYAAAGASHAIFGIPLTRLVTLTGGRVADIVKF